MESGRNRHRPFMASRALLLGAALFVACGGKVVFDGTEPSSGAGSGSSGGGGAGNMAYFIPTTTTGCLVEPPVGAVSDCGSVNPDQGGGCTVKRCDANGNQLVAKCMGTHCSCSYNGNTHCECDSTEGDFCAATPCCH
jgi:hypothetical protein